MAPLFWPTLYIATLYNLKLKIYSLCSESSFLRQIVVDCILANVHNVKSVCFKYIPSAAMPQSCVPFPDCSANHSVIKTVLLLLGTLLQLFHVIGLVVVNVIQQNSPQHSRLGLDLDCWTATESRIKFCRHLLRQIYGLLCLIYRGPVLLNNNNDRLTAFDPGQPGQAGTRRNIHPLTPFC